MGKWIPNVMARPFSVADEYVREAWEITGSPVLKRVLEDGAVVGA